MAKVGKFCLAKRVKVEWLFHRPLKYGCSAKKSYYSSFPRTNHLIAAPEPVSYEEFK